MKNFTPNLLIVTGGMLIVSPFVYLYLVYRLSSTTMLDGIAAGRVWDKVTFNPPLPEYYVPLVLVVGILCIISGAVTNAISNRPDVQAETDDFQRRNFD